ncbi:MAG TPA: MarR family winged helix-turn-helix transcriptional regulator [Candidatus Aquilonibacter sp.]|nr:MarR family winged helix-turn-helix transcriptional regulator [Candidatus Aquilonibacter sp.]
MSDEKKRFSGEQGPRGVAFLLAQLGAHGAQRFGERVAKIGLSPPDAGLLGKIASDPGIGQQALAAHLGVMPSRMVALVDELENKGIVERRRSMEDRRNHELHLTQRGRQVMGELSRIAAEHEESLCASLNREERTQLRDLLRCIADEQGLTPGVHPGYRNLRPKGKRG